MVLSLLHEYDTSLENNKQLLETPNFVLAIVFP